MRQLLRLKTKSSTLSYCKGKNVSFGSSKSQFVKLVLGIAFFGLLLLQPNDSYAQIKGKSAEAKQKNAAKLKEKQNEELEETTEKLKERHIKNQDRKTRKRMKRSAKKAKRNRENKREPFWKRIF